MNQDSPVAAESAATSGADRRPSDGTARAAREPEGDGSSSTSGGTAGTGAPRRRRRRGGRGRSRSGSGSGARAPGNQTADSDGDGGAAIPPTDGPSTSVSATKTARTPKATPKPAVSAKTGARTVRATEPGMPSGDGSGAPSATPKPRRRRGGRGRGGGGGARPAGANATSHEGAGAGDEGAVDPADGQRDDALPNGSPPTSTGTRKRRGRRGSGATKRAANAPSDVAAEPTTQPEPRRRTRAKMDEEQVEAGGPTRGLRSTRARTGRVGGRRRREDTVVVPRITDKVMVITEHGDRDQIAVLEEEVLVQHYVTRTGARSMVGNVYLGRVQNVLPGMEAAFIDIGRGRNGVLYAGEVNYSPEDLEGPQPRIEQVLKNGQPVTVQVTKDPMGGKGARLTAQISMPGRFLVFVPNANISGISRRLPDDERRRLKTIMKKVRPDGHGVIVRTAAEGASEDALTADLLRLVREWDDIQKRSRKAKAPAVLYEEPELTVRVVRDLFTDEEFKVLATDSPRVHEKVMAYVHDVAPDLESKIHLHQGRLPVFEEYRVVEQIHKALDKKVWLPSGGYLFIERTEAMTIVDVNTGKSVGKTNLEATVTNTNLEAAREVARQLRLRDIGGIIVIDFIDMLLEKNKKQVEDAMKEALAVDKTRSQVFEIGPLGLMQVTRKRVSGGLVESFSETCPTCEGRGILVNYEA
jgi:ribonuclease E